MLSCAASLQAEFNRCVLFGFQASTTIQQGSIMANELGASGVQPSLLLARLSAPSLSPAQPCLYRACPPPDPSKRALTLLFAFG